MKKILLSFILLSILTTTFAQNSKMNIDTVSYSLGVLFAKNFSGGEINDINAEMMAKGFKEALSGKEAVDIQRANQIFSEFMQQANMKKHQATIEQGRKFLEENGKRPTVKTTASGLQYEVMTQGAGPMPKPSDKVTTHYHGTLLDGTVFDSSVQRGQPIEFGVTGVIQGWQEALQLMQVGSKYKLFVPYNLAYGERGASGAIGPYSTLIFEVELIKIN